MTRPAHLRICRSLLIVPAVFLAGLASSASAQGGVPSGSFSVDPTRSMVWWQIDPHFGHLWATTCPRDPSWQPGEGHSPGYYISYANRPNIKTTHQRETRVPLFPRRTVRANCHQAVTGNLTLADNSAKGSVSINPDSITMGADARDVFSRKYVYKKAVYNEIGFSIDSLTSVAATADGVAGVAHGTLEFRGVKTQHAIPVTGNQDPSGYRVRGKFSIPAEYISHRYGVSEIVLGAGVGLNLWETIYLGFDLILKGS